MPPTRVRYSVLALLCALAMITYIDRAVFANSRDAIAGSLGVAPEKLWVMLFAFQFAYALFEVPAGWMGDVYGPRVTLLRIVVWWSFFLALTGCVGRIDGVETVFIGFTALIVVQFFFGIGEAGAFPNITRALYNWFPSTQRGFAQGAVWMSSRLMGGLAPLIWLLLVGFGVLTWRQGFWFFAGLAVVWCLAFAWWFRNKPAEHSSVNEAERTLIDAGRVAGESAGHDGVPWGKIFRSANLRWLCAMYFCNNFGWYFMMYSLPSFVKKQFGSTAQTPGEKILLALMVGGPLLLGVFGCMLGGLLTDRYVRKTGDRKWARRIYGMTGYAMASVCYAIAILGGTNVYVFGVAVAFVGFFNDLTMGPAWATVQDVGKRYSAIVGGCMNMIGNLGAALTIMVTGLIVDSAGADASVPAVAIAGGLAAQPAREYGIQVHGYPVCLALYAGMYALGVFFWSKIDASKPIVE